MNNKGIHELRYEPRKLISQHLTVSGDGLGAHSFVGDETPTIIKIAPAAGEIYRIARMIIVIEDDDLLAAGYGGLAALTNGVQLVMREGGTVIQSLTNSHPVVTNSGWGHYCYDVTNHNWGKTNELETLLIRWSFRRCGKYIELDGDKSQDLAILMDDDFSGLIDHTFIVQGYQER